MTGSYSVLLRGSVWALVTNGWEGADYTEPLWLPLTTQSFCQFEPSSFNFPSSSFHSSSPPFFSWESPASFFFIKTSYPLLLQTQTRYPCQIHWRQLGEVNMEPIDSLRPVCNSRRNANAAETIPDISNTDNNISYIQMYVVKRYF